MCKGNAPTLDRTIKLHSPLNPKKGLERGTGVINLSKHFVPTDSQLKLLNKGLTFIPTPNTNQDTKKQLTFDVQQYHRRLLLTTYFRHKEDTEPLPFTFKSAWTPKLSQVPNVIRKTIRADRYAVKRLPWNFRETQNLDKEENRALRHLRQNKNIVIKPADKGSAVVIMDREAYIKEAERQLNQVQYYKKLNQPIFLETTPEIKIILSKLKEQGYINRKQETYLMGPDNPRPRYFYLLPKIHKEQQSWSIPHEMPPGRPIVSDCGSESHATAEYIEYFLNPISIKHPSYVKDTYDFIDKIRNIKLPPDCLLFTMDVDSLYTNIDTPSGLRAVKDFFVKYPDKNRPDEALIKLLDINLNKNDFEFDSKYYLQIKGTAMGKKFAPSYANIFMAQWEEAALAAYQIKPLHYYRFLDDIWGVWTQSKEEFQKFVHHLNQFHESIKIKYTLHETEVNFLDTITYKGQKFIDSHQLDIKVFFKTTDTHALLFKTSYHPKHTFRGIVKSQLQRFYRICTQREEFWNATKTLFRALRKRGYSRSFLRDCLKTFRIKREETNKEIIPLITTFSKGSVTLNKKIKDNFKNFLTNSQLLENHKVISAYRKNKNLKDLLVHSKLPALHIKKKISTPFIEFKPKRWITNPQTKAIISIWPTIKHNISNCIYLIYCTKCDLQYIGETRNTLPSRIAQHRYNIKNKKETHTLIVQHFIQHGMASLKVMGLQYNKSWTHTTRKKLEKEWINKLSSGHPWGLNEQLRTIC